MMKKEHKKFILMTEMIEKQNSYVDKLPKIDPTEMAEIILHPVRSEGQKALCSLRKILLQI